MGCAQSRWSLSGGPTKQRPPRICDRARRRTDAQGRAVESAPTTPCSHRDYGNGSRLGSSRTSRAPFFSPSAAWTGLPMRFVRRSRALSFSTQNSRRSCWTRKASPCATPIRPPRPSGTDSGGIEPGQPDSSAILERVTERLRDQLEPIAVHEGPLRRMDGCVEKSALRESLSDRRTDRPCGRARVPHPSVAGRLRAVVA